MRKVILSHSEATIQLSEIKTSAPAFIKYEGELIGYITMDEFGNYMAQKTVTEHFMKSTTIFALVKKLITAGYEVYVP